MIYLDYNASTPVEREVREAMLPYLDTHFGNPSSSHGAGRVLRKAIDGAREQVAAFLGADAAEIVFTSGGTEANNLVIKGVAFACRHKGRHIVTSRVEHPAVVNPCRYLEKCGCEVTYVGVDSTGCVDDGSVVAAMRSDTILVSIMHANNEVGTIEPVAEIAREARKRGIIMHTDAAQSCGKIETNVAKLGVDCLTVAGHKLYAPQGIGALYVRREVEMEPLHHGAGHEQGRRSGTEAVASIVGLGAACELAARKRDHGSIGALRDRLYVGLQEALGDDAVLLGHPDKRLPNTLAVGFRGKIGAAILARCPELAASTGAACHAEDRRRSAVLEAMDVPEEVAFGAIRLSLGRFTTQDEVDTAVRMLVDAVRDVGRPK